MEFFIFLNFFLRLCNDDKRMLNEIFIKRLREKKKLIIQLYLAKEFAFYMKKKLLHLMINKDSNDLKKN